MQSILVRKNTQRTRIFLLIKVTTRTNRHYCYANQWEIIAFVLNATKLEKCMMYGIFVRILSKSANPICAVVNTRSRKKMYSNLFGIEPFNNKWKVMLVLCCYFISHIRVRIIIYIFYITSNYINFIMNALT